MFFRVYIDIDVFLEVTELIQLVKRSFLAYQKWGTYLLDLQGLYPMPT